MLLTAAVTKQELVALVEALAPLRITIDAARSRSITLGRPRLELVPDTGIRLRGDARITWDVAGVAIPVTLKSWQVLLVPRVVTQGAGAADAPHKRKSRVLTFEPVIEELDLKLVPGFLDDKIAKAIKDGIAQHKEKLTWDFARVLTRQLALPARLGSGSFLLAAVDGAVGITADDVRLTLRFDAQVAREAEVAPRSRRAPRSERRPEIG